MSDNTPWHARIPAELVTSGQWARLSPGACRLYPVLAVHADRSTGRCWPSLSKLMQLSGLSRRTVKRGIKDLAEANLLVVEREGRGRSEDGGYRTAIYRVIGVDFKGRTGDPSNNGKGRMDAPSNEQVKGRTGDTVEGAPVPVKGRTSGTKNSPKNSAKNTPSVGGGGAAGSVLKSIGIGSRKVAAIERAGIKAHDVLATWADVSKDPDVRDVAATVAHRLENGEPSKLDARGVVSAIKSGLVCEIEGTPADGHQWQYNGDGLHCDGELFIPTKRIANAGFDCRFGQLSPDKRNGRRRPRDPDANRGALAENLTL